MHCNAEQVMKGISNYAESEIMTKLPTMGKWVVGAGIGMAMDKAGAIVASLQNNKLVKASGIVDDEGNIDIDTMARHLKESASRYGKAYIDIPLVGNMAFSSDDIEILRNYITRA